MKEVMVDQYGLRYITEKGAVHVELPERIWLGSFPNREMAELFGYYYAKEKGLVLI